MNLYFLLDIIYTHNIVGGTADEKGRASFDTWLRQEMSASSSAWKFPKEGKVYDYVFDQVCICAHVGM